MRKGIALLFFLLTVLVRVMAQQQNDTASLNGLLNHLNAYQRAYPQEKVYLHLDKPYYVAGEDIWFKAYVTISQYNFLSAISKVMYVELINDDVNELVLSRRLPVVSGLAIGDFNLPDTLREGNYRVRAYTNWMRNFDEDFFFDKTFVIGNSLSDGFITSSKFTSSKGEKDREVVHAQISLMDLKDRPVGGMEVSYEIRLDAKSSAKGKAKFDDQGRLNLDFASKDGVDVRKGLLILNLMRTDGPPVIKRIPIKIQAQTPTVQFYPEGGMFLAGIANKIAFKATGNDGKGLPVRGYVESDGQHVADFQAGHAGIGSFSITPQKGKNYTAVAHFTGIPEELKVKLPALKDSGYTLAVNNVLEKMVWVQISASPELVKGQELSVVAQTNGQVFYAAKTKLNKPEISLSIDKENIPSGVVHLALFDSGMKLLAERLIFNLNQRDLLRIGIESDKAQYGKREKVNLKINAQGLNDSSKIASLSIAVTNMNKVPDSANKEVNILSALLLTADTKGYVEQPGYYFKNNTTELKNQLDNVLLTQQTDRDFWEQMKKGKFPELSNKAEKEIRISGTITKPNGEPVDRAKVTVIAPKNDITVLDTLTGPDGRFSFDKIIFYDSTNFVVQARDARGRKNVEIKLDDVPRQKVSQNKNAPDVSIDANQSLGGYLEESNKNLNELQQYGFLERSIVLDQVQVTAKKADNPAKYSSNLNGPGNADQVISGDEIFFNGCPTLDACLAGRLTGVIFRNGRAYSTRSMNRPMQIILDGMYMTDDGNMGSSPLNYINPVDIASIEVLRGTSASIYGTYGGNGVLIITTRRGDQPRKFNSNLFTPGITTFSPQGFYMVRQFTSPDYSTPDTLVGMKDLRTTIYWKPDVVTDENGKAQLSFYTADEPGIYQVVVEGLDTEGHIGRSIRYIKVE